MEVPLKQVLALEFCRNQDKVISILTKSHVNHNKIHHIRNNSFGIIFSLLESHTQGLLVLLHLGHTYHTNPRRRFASFKVTPPNDEVLCFYAPSRHSTRNQLTRGRLFEDLQNYMGNKTNGNENKILLGHFHSTMY